MTTTTHVQNSISELRSRARVVRALRREGIRLAARRTPDDAETGDFVIAQRIGSGRWLLAIGDVMGRGPEAEELAREVRAHVRQRAGRTKRLSDVLESANSLVVELAGGDRFVSLLLMEVDASRSTLRIANAGHPEPLAVGRAGGVIALEGHGPALGLLKESVYRGAGPLRMPPGVVLLATTDGVTEALDQDGQPFGRSGVSHSLAAARLDGPRAAVRRVLEDAHEHADGEPGDAATVVAFRFER